jgi:hypothetical protein
VYRALAVWPLLIAILAACRVEPTPREYIDRQAVVPGQAEAREQVEDRVRLLVQSLSAGDPSSARAAADPAPDAVLVLGEAQRFEGAADIRSVLELAASEPRRLELRHLEVRVNPRGTVGWFDALVVGSGPEGGARRFTATGVYQLREGSWELTQAHLSGATASVTAAYPAASPPPAEVE